MLILERPWTRQPQIAALLNPKWSRLISHCAYGNATYNVAAKQFEVTAGTLARTPTVAGVALDPTASAGNYIAAIPPQTGTWTILSAIITTALSSTEQIIAADDAASNRLFQFRTESGGTLKLIYFGTLGNAQPTVTGLAANSLNVVAAVANVGSSAEPACTAWANGKKGSTVGSAGVTKTWGAFPGTWFERSGGEHGAHKSLLRVIFNVPLLDSELASLTLNPWQLFAPRRIYIPTATAAATAPTITALSARSITATSAQPRISYS